MDPKLKYTANEKSLQKFEKALFFKNLRQHEKNFTKTNKVCVLKKKK